LSWINATKDEWKTILPNQFSNAPQKRYVTLRWAGITRQTSGPILIAHHLKCCCAHSEMSKVFVKVVCYNYLPELSYKVPNCVQNCSVHSFKTGNERAKIVLVLPGETMQWMKCADMATIILAF